MESSLAPIPDTAVKSLIDLVPGDIDPICGVKIKYLILKTSTFIVYVDSVNDLNWSTDAYQDFPKDFGQVTSKAKMLEHLVDRLFSGKERMQYKYLIGEGIARLLDDKSLENASAMLKEVENSIFESGNHKLKTHYITGSIVTTIAIMLFCVVFWINKEFFQTYLGSSGFAIIGASLIGGVGAFLSSFYRSLSFKADVRIAPSVYTLDGFLRIFYGIIAGLVVILAVKSNIIFGFVLENRAVTMPLLCFLAIIAGASESLIPSIIKKIEEKI